MIKRILVFLVLATSIGVTVFWIPVAIELVIHKDAWIVEPTLPIAIAELVLCLVSIPVLVYLLLKLVTGRLIIK